MLALSFQRAGGESLFSAEHTRVERELGRFFHNNNQLRGGERISAESDSEVRVFGIGQARPGDRIDESRCPRRAFGGGAGRRR